MYDGIHGNSWYVSDYLPKTGCWDGVDLSKKSKKLLCEILMKNCEPPELGRPVFDIDSVPSSWSVAFCYCYWYWYFVYVAVCMYVYMFGCMLVWSMYVCMYVCMYGMYVCMYVCLHLCI